jgi:homoserine kinase type II
MAVYTTFSLIDADRLAVAHDLGRARHIRPVSAGTVNTNYLLETDSETVFVRIYEHQDAEGVAYEWALLEHLEAAGLAVPRRIVGPGPGELTVSGKPTAVFAMAGGAELCQVRVTPVHTRAVGAFLGGAHMACGNFGLRKESRFGIERIQERLAWARDAASRGRLSDLETPIVRLEQVLKDVARSDLTGVPAGVIHGDLFRDNVRFDGDSIVCALDWESASDGPLAYDIAVTVLAWCFGDAMNWELARALLSGYLEKRTLPVSERLSLHAFFRRACVRFATTRITDIELRSAIGERKTKDYRRFLARLDAIEAETAEGLCARLGL